ncbi:MAG: DUF3224 domain-containing protein [Pyrinomonadaceae bacterium]
MKMQFNVGVVGSVGCCLLLGFGSLAHTQTRSPALNKTTKDKLMTNRATGMFDVKVTPQATDDKSSSAAVARLLLDKQFHGDLEGTSKGQMLAAGMAVEGSAGYVAMEQVSGTLQGRRGTFVLQHSGTMNRGAAQLSVSVVPDSGTEQLVGLKGKMNIKIDDGKHSYTFEYVLAETP